MASKSPISVRKQALPDPLELDSGRALAGVEIAFETYGELAADKSNAILVFHALTGDQFLASEHPLTGKPGWWARMVGPGKPIDTDRFYVICANVLGSCLGSTGPASINMGDGGTGVPYGMEFPVITIRDMVRAQMRLLDVLGIETLHAVVGGSMGGMQALSCAANFPDRTDRVLAIATTARHSAQNIAFHEVGRQAIMADPNWQGGAYYDGSTPDKGLSVARMAAHITYLSEAGLTEKFGRRLQDRDAKSFGFDADFQVESYLRYQGISFSDRFDANSYLYITRAMDYFDLAEEHGGRLSQAFAGARNTRFCFVSFDTDWLYTTADMREIVHALNAVAAPVSFVELSAPFGHDSFLLDVPPLDRVVRGFIG
ncbi:MAG: homoserine O-acetyltransferase [Alteraurantiacibacter sp. bin_em_oilr2.035]|nr:homoserine O-acetyltransferase [Alteraurantiacibacter sp. bin_em_oilr2.035]